MMNPGLQFLRLNSALQSQNINRKELQIRESDKYFFARSNSGKTVFPVSAFCYATLLGFFLIGIVRGREKNEKNY